MTLAFASGPRVLLRAVDFSYGLPAGAAGRYPARPAGMLPGRIGDGTMAESLLRLPAAGADDPGRTASESRLPVPHVDPRPELGPHLVEQACPAQAELLVQGDAGRIGQRDDPDDGVYAQARSRSKSSS